MNCPSDAILAPAILDSRDGDGRSVSLNAGLKVLTWLIFCPSRWRNHLAGLAGGLPPDFTIVRLSRSSWRDQGLRRLLVGSYLFIPAMITLLVLIARCLLGDPAPSVAYAVGFSLAGGIVSAVLLGMTVSVASGVIAAATMALACGMADGVPIRFAMSVAFSLIAGITATSISQEKRPALGQRVGGAVLGLLISSLMIVAGGFVMTSLGHLLSFDLAYGLGFGLIAGVALGLASGRRPLLKSALIGIAICEVLGVVYGYAFTKIRVAGVVSGIPPGVICGLVGGSANAVLFTALYAPSYRLARRIAGEWEGAITAALGSGGAYLLFSTLVGTFPIRYAWTLAPLSLVLGLTFSVWRPLVFFPFEAAWNRLLYRADERGASSKTPQIFRHSAFWDELQYLRFNGLDEHLVLVAGRDPEVGEVALRRLTKGNQHWAVLRARVILGARATGRVRGLAEIGTIMAQLPEGSEGYLAMMDRLRAMVKTISDLQERWNVAPLEIMKESFASTLVEAIENFKKQLQGFPEPLASEFLAASEHWSKVARQQHEETRARLPVEGLPLVFHAGNGIQKEKEAFVEREGVFNDLHQALMARNNPAGVILYGRRRTGKTSLLMALNSFMPSPEYRTAYLTMTDPKAFTSLSYFVEYLVSQVARVLDNLPLPRPTTADLPGLFAFLADCDRAIDGGRLIIALDEYENIDTSIGNKSLPEELLMTIRQSIQSHRRLAWLFAGGHELRELNNAKWSSHLISAQTVEVPMFTRAETGVLLTDPMKHCKNWPESHPAMTRVRDVWRNPRDVDRVQRESGGWPFLVQAIAYGTILLLKHREDLTITPDIWEQVLDDVVGREKTMFDYVVRDECIYPEEWSYLRRFRLLDAQPPPEDDRIAESLMRRLLISQEGDMWKMRVPIMQRWLRKSYL